MTQDYDLHIYNNQENDITFIKADDGSNLDIQTISDIHLVAQDIKRHLLLHQKTVPWDTSVGSTLLHNVNAPPHTASIESELVRIARNDTRIDQESIHITYNDHNVPILHFSVLNSNVTQSITGELQ